MYTLTPWANGLIQACKIRKLLGRHEAKQFLSDYRMILFCGWAGDEETDLDIGEMIKKSEVAWLNADEMTAAEPSTNTHPENGATQTGTVAQVPQYAA